MKETTQIKVAFVAFFILVCVCLLILDDRLDVLEEAVKKPEIQR
jgi:hypothetical protein